MVYLYKAFDWIDILVDEHFGICYLRFEIRSFVLLPMNYEKENCYYGYYRHSRARLIIAIQNHYINFFFKYDIFEL